MSEEQERTDEPERKQRIWKRLAWVLAGLLALAAIIFVPPMISIGRYKSGITQMVAQALGRPVRLSSVELRLFPRPGFVITDLSVAEDAAYGSEPVLHANTVTASVGFFALWRGRLEISRIAVDEASLNLVRSGDGRWNLDPIFKTATSGPGGLTASHAAHVLPYLVATNSRVNIKNGSEKLPFSLMNADLSFWQADPGTWRLQLRGQPARTDVNLALADTGIVRMEATLHRGPQLRQMPIHIDLEWREAQLGQLSRLVIGSDPGWRGDLTGQMQVDGTAESAQIRTRLKATNVHRAEFAPADALDFDANCSFLFHYSARSVEKLACDSPLGEGQVRLAGELPAAAPAKLTVDVQHVPVSAALDALRTVRSGVPDDLKARGTLSGRIAYDPTVPAVETTPAHHGARKSATPQPAPGPLAGNLTVEGFSLSGGGLSQPIEASSISFAPAAAEPGVPQALTAEIAVPAGAPAPLSLSVRVERRGYELGVRGTATFARLRELATVAGLGDAAGLTTLKAETAQLDLTTRGTWIAGEHIDLDGKPDPGPDKLTGTVTLHNAEWAATDLANPVQLPSATLHLDGEMAVWDPVSFAYGPVKGTAALALPAGCAEGESCPPRLTLHFDRLDAAALQAALLGAQKPDTMLSTLLERFTHRSAPLWPRLDGTITADTLALGPVNLEKASIAVRVRAASAEFTSIDATVLGGQLHASGAVDSDDKPRYRFEGGFDKVSGTALCTLLKAHCRGGTVNGGGKLTLAGYSGGDLADSAAGALRFEWRQGEWSGAPRPLVRFSRWSGQGTVAHGTLALSQTQATQGSHTAPVDASVTLAEQPKIDFPETRPAAPAHR